ncbi:unnamed protein product [Triticum turgidum subsp. durum]|uniref:DUF1365 domain-containing protein n=1 Tax=Triticum turgidum subsp. durum TaxID=4567 RepID=A0A9R1PZZ6_TRITD|nr:unnamed protein product [Triticum turgidum subsp. durum]
MEALYLLASLSTTLLTSALLSLLLLLRLPFARRPAPGGAGAGAARLYEGRVRHSRRRPAGHAFEYAVRYALVDLDLLPLSGHLSAAEARGIASTSGPVRLLTVPKSVGYEQNPLSVYYCYDAAAKEQDEDLKMCIAEVTNTPWGEKVMFTFQPGSDLVAKPLHVSPFMDMLGNWSIRANAPGDNLYVAIAVQHPTLGNYFTAALDAKLVGQTNDSVKLATFFWLMPHKVAAGIYWEAFRLWLKNVRFLDHPRYLSGSYRSEALKRDLEIRSSCSFLHQKPRESIGRSGTATTDETAENSNHQNYKDGGGSIGARWCVWTDAQWPWC